MPNQNQIVCCDIQGEPITKSVADELISLTTDKAMKLYPLVRKNADGYSSRRRY
ncbi:hypothetical protein KIN20_023106 [Parelaphostrongylus tenuis]|uniref:Uncharacterized protein n=1 Tax=Parelaphostrongylus tenuis TaxID=148309 RepID=A0AAD5MR79_PARTN|nr:hypothetical protein KIN20_023106 [Parelaphostrongylus tenuis]